MGIGNALGDDGAEKNKIKKKRKTVGHKWKATFLKKKKREFIVGGISFTGGVYNNRSR